MCVQEQRIKSRIDLSWDDGPVKREKRKGKMSGSLLLSESVNSEGTGEKTILG